jgi:CubicO group peptidase (beta-lactamase class C family)
MNKFKVMRYVKPGAVVLAGLMILACTAGAEDQSKKFPDASESDPAALGWMLGSPPPPDRTIRFEDGSYWSFPALRWTVCHFRQLMPTVNVSRGLDAPVPIPRAIRSDIDTLRFMPIGESEPMTWLESLDANYTDGIIVLHRGTIVYERYSGALEDDGKHGAMSVTKSFIGTLGAVLVAEGVLDADKQVAEYVPELAGSGFGDATIRQVLDMTTGIRFREDYTDPSAEIWAHTAAGNPLPKPEGFTGPRSYYEFLQTVKKEREHGGAFGYKTANTDALGWVIARVTGRPVNEVLSERIWRRLGAEQDAYMSVDGIGTPFAGGGLSAGLRDMARFGEMLRNGGVLNGRRILPEAVVEDIRKGGDPALFAKAGYKLLHGWSYRNMWWVTHNEHGAFMARGVHGQRIFIDPKAEMVIVRFASHPLASNSGNDPATIPAFDALAKHLMAEQ